MKSKFSPELGINIFFLAVTTAAPALAFQNLLIGLVTGIPMGLALWAVLRNANNPDAQVRNYYLFGGWAVRAFAVAIEQMAYLNVIDQLRVSQLPFGWSAVTWAWIFPCFTGGIDIWVHYTRAKVTAKEVEEAEIAASTARYEAEQAEARRLRMEAEAALKLAAERAAAKEAEEKARREKAEAEAREAAETEARRIEELKRTNPRAANTEEWKRKISEAEVILSGRLDRQPTQKEIAQHLGVTDRTIRNYINQPNGQTDK